MKIISPKFDFCFKELMRNRIILMHLISDALDIPVDTMRSVRLMNTFLWKRYRWQKQGILDVLVELNDNTKINIELQIAPSANWDRRSLFYLAKMFTEDMRAGEDYTKLKKCIHISILDFNLTQDADYHRVYRLQDIKGNRFSDLLEIHIVELRKELLGNDRLDDWIRFFNAETKEELDMVQTTNPGILEAVKEVKIMSLGNRMRLRYEAHLKIVRDRKAREDYVREEGRLEGRKEGRKEGRHAERLELVQEKLAIGQTVEQIAEDLLDTPEHIKKLMEML